MWLLALQGDSSFSVILPGPSGSEYWGVCCPYRFIRILQVCAGLKPRVYLKLEPPKGFSVSTCEFFDVSFFLPNLVDF